MNNSLRKALFVAAVLVTASLLSVTSASAAPADTQTRVIVKLAIADSAPTGATIANASDALLATLPSGDFTLINRSTALPYLTLSVGISAMSVLQSSGLVASVERDGTVSKAAGAPAKKKCKKVKRKGKKVKVCKQTKTAPSTTQIH